MAEKKGIDLNSTISRRAAILGFGQLGLFGVLLARLSYLQIINHREYEALADENRYNTQFILPQRGRITDRDDNEIAGTQQNYQVVLVPEETPDVQESLRRLSRVVNLSERQRRRLRDEIARSADFVPVMVSQNISWNQFARINFLLPHMVGVRPEMATTRHYPNKEMFSHVLGYVAHPSKDEERQSRDPLYRMPGFRIGKSGIERQLDTELRGIAGKRRVEINAEGRVQREVDSEPPQAGARVQLTISSFLQKVAWDALGEESGSVVLVDVWTGDVLVLVSKPGFDPNLFNVGIQQHDWDFLLFNERKPLVNKAVSGQYAPGSTFKMVVALAALEAGVIEPADEYDCTGLFIYEDEEFRCWRREGHGFMDLRSAIAQSCDVYFYEIGVKTGIANIEKMAKRFGLGAITDLQIPGEKAGVIPNKRWKWRNIREGWRHGDTVITAIGQGYVLATPVQLAMMTARIANGGWGVKSRLINSVEGEVREPEEMQRMENVDPFGLEMVRDAMFDVVNDPYGTAFYARFSYSEQRMAGKTGTSQVRRISQEERETGVLENKELDWNLRDHALFVGFAPVDVPRYAICVLVEHGGSGSSKAAPVARRVLYNAIRHDLRQTKRKKGETL